MNKVNKGWFKKGQVAITKGRKFPDRCGNKHPKWKGDDVGYYGLHIWINKVKGKAKKCLFCNSIKNVVWANKSYKYKRDINDFIPLCGKCHRKYDGYTGKSLSENHKKKISDGVRKYIKCSICINKHFARGFCVKHYKRLRRGTLNGVTYKAVIK